jgi:hypothetical protein
VKTPVDVIKAFPTFNVSISKGSTAPTVPNDEVLLAVKYTGADLMSV